MLLTSGHNMLKEQRWGFFFFLYNTFIYINRSNKQSYLNMFLFPNTTIRLTWHDLHINKDGCYLHDTNKPTSKILNATLKKKRAMEREKDKSDTNRAHNYPKCTYDPCLRHHKRQRGCVCKTAKMSVTWRLQQCFKIF